MTILCGTDFTPNGNDAASVAGAWGKRFKDTVQLMHVVEKPAVKSIDESLWQGYLAPFHNELEGQAERLRSNGSEVKTGLKVGAASEQLVEAASQDGVRMLIISSLGRVAVSRLLVGSVAERVAENAEVPTLVVRRPAPLIGWGEGRRALNVLVAVDFTASAEAALRWVRETHGKGEVNITLTYIGWPAKDRSRFGVQGPVPDGGHTPAIQIALDRDLRELGERVLGTSDFKTHVNTTWGNPGIKAVELSTELDVDLVVTGTHQVQGIRRLWHTSFSRTILHDSPTNVMVVPSQSSAPAIDETVVYSRVLVSTDFSELGNLAVSAALAAVDPGGILRVVHVLPPRPKVDPLREGNPTEKAQLEAHEKEKREALRQLRALIPSTLDAMAVEVEFEILEESEPAPAICHAAERFGAHMVCLSSHGRSGFARTVLGSVSNEVIRRSHRPVLVVRNPAP